MFVCARSFVRHSRDGGLVGDLVLVGAEVEGEGDQGGCNQEVAALSLVFF